MKVGLLKSFRNIANDRYYITYYFDEWNYCRQYYIKEDKPFRLLVSNRVSGYHTNPDVFKSMLNELITNELNNIIYNYKRRLPKVRRFLEYYFCSNNKNIRYFVNLLITYIS